jgi:hypothetical protein
MFLFELGELFADNRRFSLVSVSSDEKQETLYVSVLLTRCLNTFCMSDTTSLIVFDHGSSS